MFQTLTQNISKIFDKIKSRGVLTQEQIDSAMRDVRIALLEADVALSVVREFIDNVKTKASGQEVIKSISPAQAVIKIINDEMISLLSPDQDEVKLNLNADRPVNVLVVGLQGSGKTTASAKLALKLKNQNKNVLLVSLDTYRPAAQEQLAILARETGVDSLDIIKSENSLQITTRALKHSKLSGYDVVIYDSAGRLHIDEEMIREVATVKEMIKPTETLLVIDSMIGQDSIKVAGVFEEKLTISGIILSRIDGDSRGGVALSARYVTGRPIKFLSTGEKSTDFEVFDAKKIVSRILDMGDIISLVEKAASLIDKSEAEKAAAKFKKGRFDLEDYIGQIKMIKKLGGMSSMLGMIPGMSKFTAKIGDTTMGEKILSAQEAIVLSMTPAERKNPIALLNASRKRRIAMGSGTTVTQVNTLLKQFKQISTVMKKASAMSPKSLMRSGIGKLFS